MTPPAARRPLTAVQQTAQVPCLPTLALRPVSAAAAGSARVVAIARNRRRAPGAAVHDAVRSAGLAGPALRVADEVAR